MSHKLPRHVRNIFERESKRREQIMNKSKNCKGHIDKDRWQLKKARPVMLPCSLSKVLVSSSLSL